MPTHASFRLLEARTTRLYSCLARTFRDLALLPATTRSATTQTCMPELAEHCTARHIRSTPRNTARHCSRHITTELKCDARGCSTVAVSKLVQLLASRAPAPTSENAQRLIHHTPTLGGFGPSSKTFQRFAGVIYGTNTLDGHMRLAFVMNRRA